MMTNKGSSETLSMSLCQCDLIGPYGTYDTTAQWHHNTICCSGNHFFALQSDFSNTKKSIEIFIMLVLVLAKAKRVGGAYRRDLRQGTQCKVALMET